MRPAPFVVAVLPIVMALEGPAGARASARAEAVAEAGAAGAAGVPAGSGAETGPARTSPSTPTASRAGALDATGVDPAWKLPEVMDFIGVKPGDRVADIVGGAFTGALALAVGPSGRVYAVETAEMARAHPDLMPMMRRLQASAPNVVVSAEPVAAALPAGLDAVLIRQGYHDLYTRVMGPADVAAFNRAVFAALKPGGVFVVLDHAAGEGAGVSTASTLHRIEAERVKADAAAAGFTLDDESDVLRNADDDHARDAFDPAVRGRTDQFLLRFRKPR